MGISTNLISFSPPTHCPPPITPFPQSSKPNIPINQHSIIPIAERSGAKFLFPTIIIFIYLWVVIPVFTSTFAFKDLLLAQTQAGPDFYFSQFNRQTGEMWTWILNGGIENMRKLTARYVLLILSTIISALMLYSLARQRKRREMNPSGANPDRSRPWRRLFEYLRALPGIGFALLFLLNDHHLLLYAVFVQNGGDQVYKLFTLKKDLVNQIEILPAGFVFKYK